MSDDRIQRKRASANAWYHRNKVTVLRKSKENYRRTKGRKNKEWVLKTRYGLTVEDVKRMIKEQDSCCAICLKPCVFDFVPQRGKGAKANAFVVDHCHVTGVVRGLLCVGCNVAIGLLKDSPVLFTKATEYVRRGYKLPEEAFVS